MSLHFLAAIVGALIGAAGTGLLVAKCLRAPNAALVAWTVALFGLTVALAAQALGFEIGFGPIAFRAMEIGAQVLAPLALALGRAELAAKSIITRFAARLLLTAIGIVSLVIFGSDPLSDATFSKAWPATGVYYQIVPNKLLEYVLAPATVIVALFAMGFAAARPGRDPAWRDALPATGVAGVAALLLALPSLVTLSGVNVPISSLFVPICVLAAVGTWFAAWQVAGLSLEVLHQDVGDDAADDWGAQPSWAGGPATGDFGPAADDEFGIYRSNGSRQQRDDLDYRGAADHSAQQPAYPGGPADTGFRDEYGNEAGHLDDGPLYRDEAEYSGDAPFTGDLEYPVEQANPNERPLYRDGSGYPDEAGYPDAADRDAQAELFGQIAIYTLLEDRVEDFDRLTRRVVRQVRTEEPDTLVFIVHAVPSAPMQRILYEVYRDRSAYEEHKRQPYVLAFEADRRPLVLATNIIELGLQQAKVSPLPSVSDLLSDTGYDLLSDTGFGQPGYGPRPGSSPGGVSGRRG